MTQGYFFVAPKLGVLAAGSIFIQIHIPDRPCPGTPTKDAVGPRCGYGELNVVRALLRQTLQDLGGIGPRECWVHRLVGDGAFAGMTSALCGVPSLLMKLITTFALGGRVRVPPPLEKPLKVKGPACSSKVAVLLPASHFRNLSGLTPHWIPEPSRRYRLGAAGAWRYRWWPRQQCRQALPWGKTPWGTCARDRLRAAPESWPLVLGLLRHFGFAISQWYL